MLSTSNLGTKPLHVYAQKVDIHHWFYGIRILDLLHCVITN